MTTTTAPILIGTRIECILHWAGRGTVFAIGRHQRPDAIHRPHVIIHTPGGAFFDVVFDNGRISKAVPEGIMRGVQWRILSEVATPEQIAGSLAAAHCQQAATPVAVANGRARFAAMLDELRADQAHAHLVQGDDRYSGKTAAKNIRIELKAAFRGVKFSVRNKDYGAIDVRWTDGPTVAQVDQIIRKYQAGHFNSIEDIYEDAPEPWNFVFGGAKYVFASRDVSPALVTRAIAAVFDRYSANFADSGISASAEDYQAGRLWNVAIPGLGDRLDTAIRTTAASIEG